MTFRWMFSALIFTAGNSFTNSSRDQTWLFLMTTVYSKSCRSMQMILPDHVRKVQSFWEAEGTGGIGCLFGKITPILNCRFCSQRLKRERQIWRGIPDSTCICRTEKYSDVMQQNYINSVRQQEMHSCVLMPISTCVIPVSSVQNSDRTGCSWGCT